MICEPPRAGRPKNAGLASEGEQSATERSGRVLSRLGVCSWCPPTASADPVFRRSAFELEARGRRASCLGAHRVHAKDCPRHQIVALARVKRCIRILAVGASFELHRCKNSEDAEARPTMEDDQNAIADENAQAQNTTRTIDSEQRQRAARRALHRPGWTWLVTDASMTCGTKF